MDQSIKCRGLVGIPEVVAMNASRNIAITQQLVVLWKTCNSRTRWPLPDSTDSMELILCTCSVLPIARLHYHVLPICTKPRLQLNWRTAANGYERPTLICRYASLYITRRNYITIYRDISRDFSWLKIVNAGNRTTSSQNKTVEISHCSFQHRSVTVHCTHHHLTDFES